MPKLTFYPLGNADCCLIQTRDNRAILIDYADMRNPDDPADKRADLPALLRQALKDMGKDAFDVVAITHVDKDHVCGFADFFHLEWANRYQGNGRIKIRELWVPAAAILESNLEDDARVVRQEARRRLIDGRGIRVFSRPEALKDWLAGEGIKVDQRRSLISDAGTLVPTLTLAANGVEFFVHAPFGTRLNETEVIDRNNDALVLQATFLEGTENTRVFFGADINYDVLVKIVEKTEAKAAGHGPSRLDRLRNDVVGISHHCSYNALSDSKGTNKTAPQEAVLRFFEAYGQDGIVLVSTSKPIPVNDDDVQPPHRQAAAYYKAVAAAKRGQFRVTMEHPKESAPKPLVVEITAQKAKVASVPAGATAIISAPAPRAG
ncbi:hypothetical protein [Magnetospirillum sp. XM-1]|uniref:hypothetical protein n=1 Tax=Magnetospirillum sp. XM-1 TaxID=1663591 RepID=UPI0008390703|nr:hypothetical protein [Magnetospirillum sp. XM-1]